MNRRKSSLEFNGVDLCYIQGAGCTGCTVSFANCTDPNLVEVLQRYLEKLVPAWDIGLPHFYPTVMVTAGKQAMVSIDAWKRAKLRVLVIEGAVSGSEYCEVAGRPFEDIVAETAEYADFIIAYGTCAAYGGMVSATPNPTGSRGVMEFLKERHISKHVINLPGCPGHPEWLVLTLSAILKGKLPPLDRHGRPKDFFGKDLHENECPRRGYYEAEEFATDFGTKECLFKLGCRGPTTRADCPARLWNNTTFCVNAGGPCIGCTEPGFPDQMSPFYAEKELEPEVEPLLTRGFRYLSEVPSKLLDKVRIWLSVFGIAVFIVRGVLKGLLRKIEK